jgi:chromosome segregation ATPase
VAKSELQQVRQQYDDMLLSFATSQQRLSEVQKQLDDMTKERDALKADLAKAKAPATPK